MSRPRVLFVSGSGGSATLRYRVRLAEEALRSRGFATAAVHFTDPLLPSWLAEADVLALYRTPATRRLAKAVAVARGSRGIPVTFDIDDLVFRPQHLATIPFLATMEPRRRRDFEADAGRRGVAAGFADVTSGTTGPVVAELAELTGRPSHQIPNGVGRVGMQLAAKAKRAGAVHRVRLGYFSGSATHDADWAMIENAVVDLLREFAHAELLLVGKVEVGPELAQFGDRVVRSQVVPWTDLYDLLAQVDINLAPLESGRFAWGKSAIKWLEAALVQTPTIATSAPAFAAAIEDGRTGVLVTADADWREPLRRLVADRQLREDLGQAARLGALSDFGPEVQADRYAAYFRGVLAGPRCELEPGLLERTLATGARTATLGLNLEPYPFAPHEVEQELPPPRGARELTASRVVVRWLRSMAVRPAKIAARRIAARRS